MKGFIVQNANAYLEGVGDAPKQALGSAVGEAYAGDREGRPAISSASRARNFIGRSAPRTPRRSIRTIRALDQALLDRPGAQDYQVDLLENYKTNIALYSTWQAAFRQHKPKTLIVWGKHDPFFIPPGARAYLNDLPEAKLVWLDSGHFVLDENAPQVAAEIKAVFGA